MAFKYEQYSAIPTNVITGFLGVGKTTTILSLLATKPENERWAVLVNEFGEIGIDGSLLSGHHTENDGVYIKEVAGGCMCCTAGLPMQIALNRLLVRAKAHRLLIEPTGLGHPKEVLQVLNGVHYRHILNIQKTLTLVDARKLSDARYTGHSTFNQQIDIADIIVGNKQDLYTNKEKMHLQNYVKQRKGPDAILLFAENGNLDPSVLRGQTKVKGFLAETQQTQPFNSTESSNIEPPIPEKGFLRSENSGEGYDSIGWRFSSETIFSRKSLFSWMNGLRVERMKAVFITEEGVFGYNLVDHVLTEFELDDCTESRLEIISAHVDTHWEFELLNCRAGTQ